MTEIDVSDKVFFSGVRTGLIVEAFIHCVCGKESRIFPEFYNHETRMVLDCPHCGAKLYFRDAGKHRNKIVQVIDEPTEG